MKRFLSLAIICCAGLRLTHAGDTDIIVESFSDGYNAGAFKVVEGKWSESTAKSEVPGLIATKSLYNDADTTSAASAEFRPSIPADGKYEVFITYAASGNAAGVLYTVVSADGTKEVRIDQAGRIPEAVNPHSTWISLGVFTFKSGDQGSIQIRDPLTGLATFDREPNKRIYADSVRLVPVGFALPENYTNLRPGSTLNAVASKPVSTMPGQSAASGQGLPPMPGADLINSSPGGTLSGALPALPGSAAVSNTAPIPTLPAVTPAPSTAALPALPGAAPAAGTATLPALPGSTPASSSASLPALPGAAPAAGTATLPALPGSTPAASTTALPALPGAPPSANTAALPALPGVPSRTPPLPTLPGSTPAIASTMPALTGPAPIGTQAIAVQQLPPASATPIVIRPTPQLTPTLSASSITNNNPAGLSWSYDYGSATNAARAGNKNLFVFFTATNNKGAETYEKVLFQDPAVKAELDKYVLLKVDFPKFTRLGYTLGVYGSGIAAVVRPDGKVLTRIDQAPATGSELVTKMQAQVAAAPAPSPAPAVAATPTPAP